MKKSQELSKIKAKKINIKEFVSLAKKVRKTFEEEEEYLKENANPETRRFSIYN